MAVPVSPLNKWEVLKTPYIQIWWRFIYQCKVLISATHADEILDPSQYNQNK